MRSGIVRFISSSILQNTSDPGNMRGSSSSCSTFLTRVLISLLNGSLQHLIPAVSIFVSNCLNISGVIGRFLTVGAVRMALSHFRHASGSILDVAISLTVSTRHVFSFR